MYVHVAYMLYSFTNKIASIRLKTQISVFTITTNKMLLHMQHLNVISCASSYDFRIDKLFVGGFCFCHCFK